MSTATRPPLSLPARPRLRERPAGPEPRPTDARRIFLRRRLALAAGVLVLLAVVAIAAVAVVGQGGVAPPATGAATVVPADALAYLNLSTDSGRPAVRQARSLAARFPDWPLLAAAATNQLSGLVGGSSSVDYDAQIRPWLGGEVALAWVPASDQTASPLAVLDVARPARARAFVASAGAAAAGVHDGIRLFAYPSGTELAFVGHYLLAGPAPAVEGAIDAARGHGGSLAENHTYQRAAVDEPADRVLDLYLPAVGVRRLLADRTGVAGAIGLLLDRPGVLGTAISVSAVTGGARVLIHSALSAGAAHPSSFTPSLQSVLPSGSSLMLDVDGLDHAAPQLLAATAIAGIGANVGPLLRRLGTALSSQGVDLHQIVSLFSGETAVAVAPGATPALLIVAREANPSVAGAELASLEAPLTALFSPSDTTAAGQVPVVSDTDLGGVSVHELQLGPGLQLDFGVFNGFAVVSTSISAIERVAERSRGLADDPAYQATVPSRLTGQSSVVFGDLSRLLPLAEQMGLAGGARTRELLPDLSKIRAIGLHTTVGQNATTTELRLEIP